MTRKSTLTGWLFALPHLILFTVFLLVPVGYGFWISLHNWHILARTHPFVGLDNYQAALADDIFWVAARNTAGFVLLIVPLGNIVSLLLALGIHNLKRGATFYRAVFYLPGVISIAVVAVLWRWLYNTQAGLLNLSAGSFVTVLRTWGLPVAPFQPIAWLSDPQIVMIAIVLMTIWWTAGGNMVLYLAGLGGISNDYYEAARVDGARSWAQFRHITLPLLAPTILFCLVISVLGTFQIFGQSYVLFAPGSGPARSGLTLALYMYQQGFNQYEIGYGAAIAYLLFAAVLIVTVLQFGLLRGGDSSKDGK